MAQELSIPTILKIGQLSQVLSSVGAQKATQFKGESINDGLSLKIYRVWKPLSLRYLANPSDPTIRQMAEYMLSLCGLFSQQSQLVINNLSGTLPVITGPSNQSVAVGATATFSVTVVSATTVSYAWYLGGVLISGATSSSYQVINATLLQNGGVYTVVATNATGSVTSNPATLTVTNVITGFFYYNASDPGPTLLANSDPFTYQVNYAITHNSPITITMPSASSPNMYLICKVPSTESAKTTWFNDGFNSGVFPDSVWQNVLSFGGFTYYYTRSGESLNTSQTLILS